MTSPRLTLPPSLPNQMLDSAAVIASQLLLVDEVIRAGKQMKKG